MYIGYNLGFPLRGRGDDLEGNGSAVGGISVIFNLYALRVGTGMSLLSLGGGPQVGIDCAHDVLLEGRPGTGVSQQCLASPSSLSSCSGGADSPSEVSGGLHRKPAQCRSSASWGCQA